MGGGEQKIRDEMIRVLSLALSAVVRVVRKFNKKICSKLQKIIKRRFHKIFRPHIS
jgi:hypothetical protein